MGEQTPQDIVVTPGPLRVRLSPLGTWMHARAFKVAADLAHAAPWSTPGVIGFLYSRAIELALKSYLVLRGQSSEDMRAYSHNLSLLLTEAYTRSLDFLIELTDEEKDLIRMLGDLNDEGQLGYFHLMYVLKGPRLPYAKLSAVTERLLQALRKPCMAGSDADAWSPTPPGAA
jgi:hypothetical protein